jgi:5-methylthioadenosine/S-adenosylhomocysteine deaminase
MKSSIHRKRVDMIIANGVVLTGSPGEAPLQSGALAIDRGKIIALDHKERIESMFQASKSLDARGGLIMPGLINCHTHLPMSLFRGYADDLPLENWLRDYIFPMERKCLSPEWVYWGSLLSLAESIRCGTTTLADGYFFEEEVARAVEESGVRAILGQGILDFPTPDSPSPEDALSRAETLIQKYQGHPLIQPALFPHTVYTCSPPLLQKCFDLAERYQTPMMIHLAETKEEVKEILGRYGRSPICHLNHLGLLSPSLIASHCVWVTEEEMNMLTLHGVKVVHNPESNMKLAAGVAPIPDFLARKIPVGLGSDGCASNNNLDLFQEMDTAAKLHKIHRLNATQMPAPVVLEMATLGGAKVLGLEKSVGSLEVGKKADIIVVELNRPHLQPPLNLISHLVYSAVGSDVRDVIVEGRILMEDRKLLTLDEERILHEAKELTRSLNKK